MATSARSENIVSTPLVWSQLSSIPDLEGFAGTFAGVSGNALLVAGGANITGDKWGEVFTKTWYDSVFALERRDGPWKRAGQIPHRLGYGVSVSVDDSVLCIGGSDLDRHYADVFRLRWKDGALEVSPLPSLPKPCANACGALLGRTVYIAGGIETPSSTVALKTFWALDLDESEPRWRELEPWPGPERMLAVAGVQDGSFFIFSGTRLATGADGKPARELLRDAYRFTPGKGWKRIADLPRATVAAPSPAVPFRESRLLIFTGDDGTKANFQPVEKHPGFPRDVIAYDTGTDTWCSAGEAPFSRATVPVVHWNDHYVIPNGEVRPRVRTPEVWSLQIPDVR